jgi:hypothetical protein
MFGKDRPDRFRLRRLAGHVTGEMDDRIAGTDVGVEFVERAGAEVLEILLDLHFGIVAREVAAKLFAIVLEFIGNTGDENLDGHRRPRSNRTKRGKFCRA